MGFSLALIVRPVTEPKFGQVYGTVSVIELLLVSLPEVALTVMVVDARQAFR